MLTDYQLEVAGVVAEIAGPEGFALAGGGAMITQGIVDRATKDLDFFTIPSDRVAPTASRVVTALGQHGFAVSRLIDTEAFVRLDVRRGEDVCEVDLGQDARRWPTIDAPIVGATLAAEELAADKTLALLGRAAPRDFVDVHALAGLLGEERLCELAADKDLGFRRTYLAEALVKFYRLDRDQFEVDADTYRQLQRWAEGWRIELMAQAKRLEPDLSIGRDRDRGPEIGP